MYKNLNAESLGISARQHELIELALTYKFRGIDLDVDSLMKQVELHGMEHATRYLTSANVRIGGFELPVRWEAEDADYQEDLKRLAQVAQVAASLGAVSCTTIVLPYSDGQPYHENFEFHRRRLTEIADFLQSHGIRLGLSFRAPASCSEGHVAPFIATPDALVTLIKTIVSPNIGLTLDLWDWHVGGGSLDQIKELSPEQIVAVRVADVPADVDLREITEEQRLVPGATGVVPAAAALRWLSAQGYRGPVTAYCHPVQFSGVTRTQAVEQAAQSLANLMGTAEENAESESNAATANSQ